MICVQATQADDTVSDLGQSIAYILSYCQVSHLSSLVFLFTEQKLNSLSLSFLMDSTLLVIEEFFSSDDWHAVSSRL